MIQNISYRACNPTVPFGSPSRAVKFLGGDVFHSLKMLAQLEMPDACFDQLPSLRRAEKLYEMVSESREAYRAATCDQSFTASDVQQVLHDFFASNDVAKQWLLQRLRISQYGNDVAQRQHAEHLHNTLGINAPLGSESWGNQPSPKNIPTAGGGSVGVPIPPALVSCLVAPPMIRARTAGSERVLATHEQHVRQVDVLYKHRRSTCMRDRDLCFNNSCISHNLSIHRSMHQQVEFLDFFCCKAAPGLGLLLSLF